MKDKQTEIEVESLRDEHVRPHPVTPYRGVVHYVDYDCGVASNVRTSDMLLVTCEQCIALAYEAEHANA